MSAVSARIAGLKDKDAPVERSFAGGAQAPGPRTAGRALGRNGVAEIRSKENFGTHVPFFPRWNKTICLDPHHRAGGRA